MRVVSEVFWVFWQRILSCVYLWVNPCVYLDLLLWSTCTDAVYSLYLFHTYFICEQKKEGEKNNDSSPPTFVLCTHQTPKTHTNKQTNALKNSEKKKTQKSPKRRESRIIPLGIVVVIIAREQQRNWEIGIPQKAAFWEDQKDIIESSYVPTTTTTTTTTATSSDRGRHRPVSERYYDAIVETFFFFFFFFFLRRRCFLSLFAI